MRKVSLKKAKRNRERQRAYEIVDENWDGICSGCELELPCSHSHIIPVSEAIELEADSENITHHCKDCHIEWESHNIERMKQLKDFEKNMNYIKRVRPLYYNRLIC